ncbi:Tetratricopeptide repeat [Arabidopsis suecica]|uniref:Tetratricopeptide repeat n=1 Tax=Arabidopsis suecica TaxID=45249 RepID=A0A8T2AEF0_ARASU|nr:Tetratricopeptide repeat [Arabidopsis suecica]
MVLIESNESDDEITVKEEQNQSRSSSSQPETTTATDSKLVAGDDSDGFETASEREVSDNEEEDEIEQIQQSDKPENKDDESKQKAMEDANEAKLEGNKLFGNGVYEEALLKYELALQFAQEVLESEELRSICYSNRAICYLKLGKYAEAIKECTKAIELNPSYTKAFVRRAEAHENLEHFEEALTDLKKILELDPSNDQTRKGIRRLEPLAAEKREKNERRGDCKAKGDGKLDLGSIWDECRQLQGC